MTSLIGAGVLITGGSRGLGAALGAELARRGARVVLVARGLLRVLGGAARVVLGTVTRSIRHQARGSRSVARGIGMAAGAFGYTRQEYKRR